MEWLALNNCKTLDQKNQTKHDFIKKNRELSADERENILMAHSINIISPYY